nr:TonB-dependent receptor [Acidobacteriota bacterium]
ARFTIDGGSVTAVGLGGAQMGFSQEAVQEFQVSTVNFDLSAGMTDAAVINVVTRAGGSVNRGTAFYFFRDHNLAAYPAIQRDRIRPDAFFQRQQFGLAAGGPIRRERIFYFGSWERNDQRAVAGTTLLAPDFAHFSRISASPLAGDLFSLRFDARITASHTVFARHSRDRSRAFGPAAAITGGALNSYPSNWSHVRSRADQSLVGLTSVLGSTLVNDLRFSTFVLASTMGAAGEQDCQGCLGVGAPSISVLQAGLVIGNSTAIDNFGRRFHLNDSITWQGRAHRVRVGFDWEHNRERNLVWGNEPVSMTLFSPDRVRAYNARPDVSAAQLIPLPSAFATLDDILRLPLQSFSVGIGDAGVPQEDGGRVRHWNTVWLYAEDTWRLHDRLTMTYGLGWGRDGNLNHDLHKPLLLAPLLGPDGLRPTRPGRTNFSPAAGIAWTPSSDHMTVVRAGAGRYYRPHGLTSSMDAERVALGPPGLGRQNVPGGAILNWIPGIPALPVGAPFEFRNSPTLFTGADLMAFLPAVRAGLVQSRSNADPAVQQIQVTKQAAPAIFPVYVPNPSAVHLHLGLQRELGRGLVVSADAVDRRFTHVPQGGGAIDVNHFNSVRGAVVPRCSSAAQAEDPQALCSLGPINVQKAPYHFAYKGVVVRIEKRAPAFTVLGSYAYSRTSGTNTGNGFDLDDWLQNAGPAANDLTHILNVAGMVRLPARVDLGFNLSVASVPPFSAYVGGMDFNGDGTTGDLLPGSTVNRFNRGLAGEDLERLVADFNRDYAGTRDAQGALVPRIILPGRYSLGDDFHTLDLRLSRSFRTRSRLVVSLLVEAFNVYNAANLSGYSGDLTIAAFGQPTQRVTQVFGSGGPRSLQLAARLSF